MRSAAASSSRRCEFGCVEVHRTQTEVDFVDLTKGGRVRFEDATTQRVGLGQAEKRNGQFAADRIVGFDVVVVDQGKTLHTRRGETNGNFGAEAAATDYGHPAGIKAAQVGGCAPRRSAWTYEKARTMPNRSRAIVIANTQPIRVPPPRPDASENAMPKKRLARSGFFAPSSLKWQVARSRRAWAVSRSGTYSKWPSVCLGSLVASAR